jgi:septum formation protein
LPYAGWSVISPTNPLALGSASPRRKELLERLAIPLVTVPAHIDERRLAGETADDYLARIAARKLALASADKRAAGCDVVLAADTIVLLDDEILGKPESAPDASEMLFRLSGRSHQVRTRFVLGWPNIGTGSVPFHAETLSTVVHFRPLDAEEIARYVVTGEGSDKAGAYAIQGVGSFAVSRIEGSYANVVGLPICEVILALKRHGCLGPFP